MSDAETRREQLTVELQGAQASLQASLDTKHELQVALEARQAELAQVGAERTAALTQRDEATAHGQDLERQLRDAMTHGRDLEGQLAMQRLRVATSKRNSAMQRLTVATSKDNSAMQGPSVSVWKSS